MFALVEAMSPLKTQSHQTHSLLAYSMKALLCGTRLQSNGLSEMKSLINSLKTYVAAVKDQQLLI